MDEEIFQIKDGMIYSAPKFDSGIQVKDIKNYSISPFDNHLNHFRINVTLYNDSQINLDISTKNINYTEFEILVLFRRTINNYIENGC